jgi:hypothetical protein
MRLFILVIFISLLVFGGDANGDMYVASNFHDIVQEFNHDNSVFVRYAAEMELLIWAISQKSGITNVLQSRLGKTALYLTSTGVWGEFMLEQRKDLISARQSWEGILTDLLARMTIINQFDRPDPYKNWIRAELKMCQTQSEIDQFAKQCRESFDVVRTAFLRHDEVAVQQGIEAVEHTHPLAIRYDLALEYFSKYCKISSNSELSFHCNIAMGKLSLEMFHTTVLLYARLSVISKVYIGMKPYDLAAEVIRHREPQNSDSLTLPPTPPSLEEEGQDEEVRSFKRRRI